MANQPQQLSAIAAAMSAKVLPAERSGSLCREREWVFPRLKAWDLSPRK